MENVLAYIAQNESRFLRELDELLGIPSVSSQSGHDEDVRRCAQWCADHLTRLGFDSTVHSTKRHPIVTAEWMQAPGRPTVLIYGHYDVQPVDPLNLWDSPPFEPTVRDGQLYARGAVDDKGQFLAHFKALEAFMKTEGRLPLNVKVLLEGEEEVGSESLWEFVPEHKDLLSCDLIVISDSPMVKKGLPTITLGLRGLVYFQVNLATAGTDLHSGSFGGGVPNAATAACELISKLKGPDGKILIPHFYDDVLPIGIKEKESYARLPFDEKEFMNSIGVTALTGESGFSTLERLWVRPTLDVMGILSGYTGEGAKTVIPRQSMVKVSMRLVPNQDAEKIRREFESYLETIKPVGATLSVEYLHGGPAYYSDPDHPAFAAAEQALRKGFGQNPVFNREGGSIPIVSVLNRELKAPCLLVGLGLPDENAHAPNEHIDLDNLKAGFRAFAHLLDELGRMPR